MVIYEDNHLLVINKMPGELVQGDHTRDPTILDKYKDYIKKKYRKAGAVFLHPAHRLDRPVSGCVLLARTSKALSRMTMAFKNGAVEKKYYAICSERYEETEGQLIHHIVKDSQKNVSKISRASNKKTKKAVLRYKLVAATSGKYLYEIHPLTGRSHQIRVQLSAIGCPIYGDVKYGGHSTSDGRAIYLHCSSLAFTHPTKKDLITVHAMPGKNQLWRDFISFMKESKVG